jgi:hypothetical protein
MLKFELRKPWESPFSKYLIQKLASKSPTLLSEAVGLSFNNNAWSVTPSRLRYT